MATPSDYEIMAPAGSWESLAAGLEAGAGSVYFGAGELHMRSAAARAFGLGDIPEVARRCRAAGARAYLTVNAVAYDEDMAAVDAVLAAAAAGGVDAVIASDVAVILRARALGLPVHLSTQCNVANADAARFWARMADAVVLARELTLGQVRAVADAIAREGIQGPSGRPLRLELFCHGALCMAVSGRCSLSLATGGRSASRGACLQPCRRSYRIVDDARGVELAVDEGRVLSPADLKTVDVMDRMVASGATIFKIEGRARSPEYVATAVACYREALESVLAGDFEALGRDRWDARLAGVFNRGFWHGWYLGERTLRRVEGPGSQATVKKVYAGKCVNYFARAGAAQFALQGAGVAEGDRLLATGPTTGAWEWTAPAMRDAVTQEPMKSAPKGASVTMACRRKLRAGDALYKLVAVR
ncbi:MAG: U32 family peptidase [Duodenibacillus sp.]|nr:U32 family peptidase [Duodenibacillus sp.]